jgi:hypothetical protein
MIRIILLTTSMLAWMAAGTSPSPAIDCEGAECRGQTIACPEGADCMVRCDGEGACRDARFVAPRDHKMVVSCNGEAACASATFSGSLDVRCDGEDACRETELSCGAGSCDWLCVDDDACTGLVVR